MPLFIFTETVNGILPVFLVIFVGIFLNRLHFFSETTKDEIVKLVFYAGTPALLFLSVGSANLYQAFQPNLILFLIAAILIFLGLLILLCRGIRDAKKKAAVIQIGFRSNFAIVGMPLAINLMPKEGVAMTAIALAFVVITYNVLAVIVLSYYGGKKRDLKSVFKNVIKNPLIISTVLGLLWSLFRLPLPVILEKSISYVGDIATSMGLLVLGATISVNGWKENRFPILCALFFRNFLAPVLFLTSAILLGFRGYELIITAILSASPAAVNCFVMAKKMGADPDISAYGVSFSSLLSIFSIFISVYLLRYFSLA